MNPSIEMFKSICEELAEWIKEKKNALANDGLATDLKGIEALQRRHAVSQFKFSNTSQTETLSAKTLGNFF